jgi:ATP-binding cassette subfamily F protein 3
VKSAEKAVAELQAQCSDIDRAMFDPSSAKPELTKLTMSELARRRAALGEQLAEAEAVWLECNEKLEALN